MVLDQPASATDLAAGLNLTVDCRRGSCCWTCSASMTAILLKPRIWKLPACWLYAPAPGALNCGMSPVAGASTHGPNSPTLSVPFVLEGQTARLTQAALETLAVIAYRQPVSRARVSAIRGVNVDSVVRTLTQRGLIEDSGTDPESGAVLYRTTSYFLERMGIGSVAELPQISPHLPGLEGIEEFYDAGRM